MGKLVEVPNVPGMLYDADADMLLWSNGKPVVVQKIRSGKRRRVRYVDAHGMERSSTADALKKAATTGKPEPMTFHAESTRDAREVRKRKYELKKASDAKLRYQLMSDSSDERHGTMRGYQLGCRCGACKRASKINYRKRQVMKTIRDAGRNPYTGGEL